MRVREHLVKLLSEVVEAPVMEENARLFAEIPGWDSLNYLQWILRVEEEFDLQIDWDEEMEVDRVDDVLRFLEQQIEHKGQLRPRAAPTSSREGQKSGPEEARAEGDHAW